MAGTILRNIDAYRYSILMVSGCLRTFGRVELKHFAQPWMTGGIAQTEASLRLTKPLCLFCVLLDGTRNPFFFRARTAVVGTSVPLRCPFQVDAITYLINW